MPGDRNLGWWQSGTMPDVTPAAARPACGEVRHPGENPLIVQETNNTVVWLRPSDVIAKVGTRDG
jgi:hypothetical protein